MSRRHGRSCPNSFLRFGFGLCANTPKAEEVRGSSGFGFFVQLDRRRSEQPDTLSVLLLYTYSSGRGKESTVRDLGIEISDSPGTPFDYRGTHNLDNLPKRGTNWDKYLPLAIGGTPVQYSDVLLNSPLHPRPAHPFVSSGSSTRAVKDPFADAKRPDRRESAPFRFLR